jgi:hypothetical protein
LPASRAGSGQNSDGRATQRCRHRPHRRSRRSRRRCQRRHQCPHQTVPFRVPGSHPRRGRLKDPRLFLPESPFATATGIKPRVDGHPPGITTRTEHCGRKQRVFMRSRHWRGPDSILLRFSNLRYKPDRILNAGHELRGRPVRRSPELPHANRTRQPSIRSQAARRLSFTGSLSFIRPPKFDSASHIIPRRLLRLPHANSIRGL